MQIYSRAPENISCPVPTMAKQKSVLSPVSHPSSLTMEIHCFHGGTGHGGGLWITRKHLFIMREKVCPLSFHSPWPKL